MSIPTTSYVLDSRQKSVGSTVSVANYNLAALGSPVEAGTYEMLSFNARNNVFNVDDSNDEIYFFEDDVSSELGPATLVHGYYTTESALEIAGAGTYTLVFSALTNSYNIAVSGGAATFNFTWGTNTGQPMANLLLGFNEVDTVDSANVDSTRGTDLDPHSNLLISITEDSLKNVTLVNGTEFSLIVPLNVPYGDQMDSLKADTFNQTVRFVNTMNQLNVSLFTEDGVVLPDLNASQYELILRKVF